MQNILNIFFKQITLMKSNLLKPLYLLLLASFFNACSFVSGDAENPENLTINFSSVLQSNKNSRVETILEAQIDPKNGFLVFKDTATFNNVIRAFSTATPDAIANLGTKS